jgi:GT2 family glycosyltransferase/ADP-heptose:LPS heptosyltransferase
VPEIPSPLVAVIVVTWNGREHLRRCLDALARQTFRDFCTIVVDNASADGTAEMMRGEFADVRLIVNAANLGFAAANNVGIRATESPLIATLNNDAVPEPSWLAALVRVAQNDPSLGSVASKMVSARDPESIDSCGIALDRAGIAWDRDGGYPAELVKRRQEVFGPCAGAALYRRAMLEDVGLFDEDYFAYLEDVDLAWRARLRRWRSYLAPDAVVRHEHAATLGDASPLKRYLLARNKVWTIAKCLPARDLWRSLPLIVVYDVGAATFGVARQRDWASVRGRVAGLAALPQALAKRRTIQAQRPADVCAIDLHYSPLALPWDVPRRYRHLIQPRRGRREVSGEYASPSVSRAVISGEGAPTNPERSVSPGVGASLSPARRNGGWPLPVTTRPLSMRAVLRRSILRLVGLMLSRSGRRQASTPKVLAQPGPWRSPRVLIMRPDHLGDVLLARPAIDLVRRSLPDAELTVLAGPWGVPSLRGVPARIAEFPFPGFTREAKRSPIAPYAELLALATRLRGERLDAALVLRPDHWWGALALTVAGVPVRVGHLTPDVAPFLTDGVDPIAREAASRAALRAASRIVRALGREPAALADDLPRFEPSSDGRRAARAWLGRVERGRRPIVAIHPGAGSLVKCWPSGRWAQVVDAIAADASVLLTAAGEEATIVAAIQAAVSQPVPAALNLTWDTLAALYEQVDLVAGMDSGPLHLAAAVGTATVRVYGPTDAVIYGPAGPRERHHIVQAELPCAPCGNLIAPPCGYLVDPPCLAAAQVEQVVDLIRTSIAERATV